MAIIGVIFILSATDFHIQIADIMTSLRFGKAAHLAKSEHATSPEKVDAHRNKNRKYNT